MRAVALPHIGWSFWSIAHLRLLEPVGPNAEIVELWIGQLKTDPGRKRTFCFDELAFHNEPMEPLDLEIPAIPSPTTITSASHA